MSLKDIIFDIQKPACLIGFGKSAIETLKFLHKINKDFIVFEKATKENFFSKSKFIEEIKELNISEKSVFFDYESIDLDQKLIVEFNLIVLSPGVDPNSASVSKILSLYPNAFVTNEVELSLALIKKPYIVITGSNGKSTTSSLIFHILENAGMNACLCGNIGKPVISQYEKFDSFDVFIIEASSYQLEILNIRNKLNRVDNKVIIKPHIGIILNLTENHLERHGNFETYVKAKTTMLFNQDNNDFAILNCDDSNLLEILPKINSQVISFGKNIFKEDIKVCPGQNSVHRNQHYNYVKINSLYSYDIGLNNNDVNNNLEKLHYNFKSLKLFGEHNAYNIAASIAAVISLIKYFKYINFALHKNFSIQKGISSIENFDSLKHRIQIVGQVQNKIWINDSKATTPDAVVSCLQAVTKSYENYAIKLLIGGVSKQSSWDNVIKILNSNKNLIKLFLFGKDSLQLSSIGERSNVPTTIYSSLRECLKSICVNNNEIELIVLSPGCASFDEFKDFEERGNFFIDYVRNLRAS